MAGNHNSGRRPKPTALKVIEGNRGHRALNENEPRPDPVAPECPDWLHKWAKEMWAWIVPQLEQMGVIGRCDLTILVALCQSWARWRQAEETLDREGLTYQSLVMLDGDGKPVSVDAAKILMKEHPAAKIAARERAACVKAAIDLGLSPTVRARIISTKPGGTGAPPLLPPRAPEAS